MCFSRSKSDLALFAVSNGVQEVVIFLFANESKTGYVDHLHFQCGSNSPTPGRPLLDLKIKDIMSISYKTHAFSDWELIIHTRSLIPLLRELTIQGMFKDKSQIKKFINAVNEMKELLSSEVYWE